MFKNKLKEMDTFKEFKRRVRKLTEHRKHKVRNSLGVYDAYKWIRKNKWLNIGKALTEHEFYSIIRDVNNLISAEISLGKEVKLPNRMGSIELRKYDKSIKIGKDGKVVTNLPIDWDSTLKLWYEDEEAYKNKTLLRIDEKEIYKIVYNKEKANYNNRSFYEFSFNKDLKIRLKRNIKEGLVDALYIGRRVKYVE